MDSDIRGGINDRIAKFLQQQEDLRIFQLLNESVDDEYYNSYPVPAPTATPEMFKSFALSYEQKTAILDILFSDVFDRVIDNGQRWSGITEDEYESQWVYIQHEVTKFVDGCKEILQDNL